eukprot:Gb_21436 [translate_table: standard]
MILNGKMGMKIDNGDGSDCNDEECMDKDGFGNGDDDKNTGENPPEEEPVNHPIGQRSKDIIKTHIQTKQSIATRKRKAEVTAKTRVKSCKNLYKELWTCTSMARK